MKIISFMAIKGGVGKTTMAFQLAKYDQKKGNKVLLIDLDSQKSLTDTFVQEHMNFSDVKSIVDLLNNPNVGLIQTNVEQGIDIIPALMSRIWTGFFGTERCRAPKIFQNPDFSLKRRDFWVFLEAEQGRALPVRENGWYRLLTSRISQVVS